MPRTRTGTRRVITPATMGGLLAALAIACSGGGSPPAASVGCAKDTECKGSRICVSGVCTNAGGELDATADVVAVATESAEAGALVVDAGVEAGASSEVIAPIIGFDGGGGPCLSAALVPNWQSLVVTPPRCDGPLGDACPSSVTYFVCIGAPAYVIPYPDACGPTGTLSIGDYVVACWNGCDPNNFSILDHRGDCH
jgi:hypothetical protein